MSRSTLEPEIPDGFAVVNGFAVTPTLPTTLGDLQPGGNLIGEWLIVPGELGITDTNGAIYNLDAQMVYTITGEVYTTTTYPRSILVYPQPYVRLDFAHSQPDENGDFEVEISAENDGYGTARHLAIDLSQVSALSDLDGNDRSLLFELKETTIDGEQQENQYLFNFGDLQPGERQVGRWLIGVSTSDGLELKEPLITGFEVGCQHQPYLGLELSALLNCGQINQPYLTGDCPFCGLSETSVEVGGPINTSNGNYTYRQSTPSIPTVSDPLQLRWTYNSLNSGVDSDFPLLSSALGVGWTHNYQLALDLSELESPKRAAVMRAPHGTPIYFELVREHFEPAPGVRATMAFSEVATNQYVYTVTTASQATYVFTDTGKLWQQIDAQGNRTLFSYDQAERLTQVLEPVSKRYLNFAYDEAGQLISVTDPVSRTTQFGYTDGRLTTITDTRGYVWVYDYTQLNDEYYILSHVQDPDGRTVEQTAFDEKGRAVSQTFNGQNLSIAYLDDGRRVITDGLGIETIHIYNKQNLLVAKADAGGKLETFVLDGRHNRTYSEDRNGNPTFYDKTAFGYTTAITDALGNATRFGYDGRNNLTLMTDALGHVTNHEYDGQNNLRVMTDSLGNTTYYTYNSQGQVTSVTDPLGQTTFYEYDNLGQRTAISDTLGNTTLFGYDAVGRLITTTNALGQITLSEYDGGDNLIRQTSNYLAGQPVNYLNEYNLVTSFGYNRAGQQTVITDTLGKVSVNEYDSAGRLIKSIDNYSTTLGLPTNEYNLVTSYGYDELGQQVAVTNTLGYVTVTEYDDDGRVERTITNVEDGKYEPEQPDYDILTHFEHDANGNLVSVWDTLGRETRTEYDTLNRVLRTIVNYQDGVYDPESSDQDLVTSYGYDALGNQVVITDTLGRVSLSGYDAANRLITTTNALSGTTIYAYDAAGNRISVTNANGHSTHYGYDSLNRTVVVTDSLGGTTHYAYNTLGQQTVITNALNYATNKSYDNSNRLALISDALGYTTTVTYDPLGRRLTTTDAAGQVTRYEYDSLGRLSHQIANFVPGVPSDHETNVSTYYTYDALGRRTTVTDALGRVTSYSYDALGRTRLVSTPGTSTRFTYDGLGNRLSMTNGEGETTGYAYDQSGRLITMTNPLSQTTVYQYDAAGNQIAVIDGEQRQTCYNYDALDRLVRIFENCREGAPSTNEQNVTTLYGYDAVGNHTVITNALGGTSTFTYDELNRLTHEEDPLGHITHLEYDAIGNRTVLTDANGVVTSFIYDPLNRLTTIDYPLKDDVTLSYDALGNRLAMSDTSGTTTYLYDELYRLTENTNGAGETVEYSYDPVGNRTELIHAGLVVTYSYDAANRLATVSDGTGGFYNYTYDQANRLVQLTRPNLLTTTYQYDDASRLVDLTHASPEGDLANYRYELDGVGNQMLVTESLLVASKVITGFIETDGLLVIEAEDGLTTADSSGHSWMSQTTKNGYTGRAYLRAMPDVGAISEANEESPSLTYQIKVTTPASYTLWIRGMAPDASGDSLRVGLNGQELESATRLTGFSNQWGWSSITMNHTPATLPLNSSELYTLTLWMREDGLRIDRFLLVSDPNYIPVGDGPPANESREITTNRPPITRLISYTYDQLSRLTAADISDGRYFHYDYDAVGNRLTMTTTNEIITTYSYDAANRLTDVNGSTYSYDANGNLLNDGTNNYTYDAANRLTSVTDGTTTSTYLYDGTGNRVVQTVNGITTPYVLDIAGGLPEVIAATTDGIRTSYLQVGSQLLAQDNSGTWQYILPDHLGSMRQLVNANGEVMLGQSYSPFGVMMESVGVEAALLASRVSR